MQTPAEFKTLPLAAIATSLTNPRKTFNPDKLQELANSIAASGVHQPVLVRPLPGVRVPDTEKGVEFELVAGERRYRASKLANVPTIPVLVRELTDAQVIEIQIVENLQRDDLAPLEEADGYQQLIDATGISKEELAAKINKSRTYVFNRLKLLDLCAEGREAMRTGQLDAIRGELIARIPDHKLQLVALKEFTSTVFGGDPRMGYRACKAWITANVMLRLEAASFKPGDETLRPGAGACTTCPKRTGANPDLFNDVEGPDLCTDPACFHAKEAAAIERALDERRAKGMEVVEGDDLDAHTALDAAVSIPGGDKTTVAELMNQFMTNAERKKYTKAGVVGGQVVNLIRAKLVEDLVADAAAKAIEQGKTAAKPTAAPATSRTAAERAEAQRKLQLETQYEAAWRGQVAQALKPLLLGGALVQFDAVVLRKMLVVILQGMDWAVSRAALDLPAPADQATERAAVAALPDTELGPRICLALALEEAADLRRESGDQSVLTPTTILQHLAATCGVDVAAIQAQVQQDMRAQLVPAGKAEKPVTPGATPPKGGGGKNPKLTAAQAQQRIAEAMQSNEAAASCGAAAAPADPAPADPLLAKALSVITQAQKASVRLLKEQLGIGTTKAMELMEQLEAAGKVSPAAERGARKVLVAA